MNGFVRDIKISDAGDICRIFNKYVTDTTITFEEVPLKTIEMQVRIKKITEDYPWLVYEENGRILGYTYANRWKERSAYRYAVETGIYMDSDEQLT